MAFGLPLLNRSPIDSRWQITEFRQECRKKIIYYFNFFIFAALLPDADKLLMKD